MLFSKKRNVAAALLAAVVAATPIVLAPTPAQASEFCQYFAGPTPAVEADLDGDGNPDVRVPSATNVSLCAQDDVFVHGQQARLEMCDWFSPFCWALYVDLEAGVTVDTGFRLCRSLDGVPTCSTVDVTPVTVWTPEVNTICIGFDIDGGSPCSHGMLVGFE